jgi:F-box protein 9
MFLDSPHLRFDGLYVSRNTYIRQGVAEWKREKTCHLVTYFRYFRCAARGVLTESLSVAYCY